MNTNTILTDYYRYLSIVSRIGLQGYFEHFLFFILKNIPFKAIRVDHIVHAALLRNIDTPCLSPWKSWRNTLMCLLEGFPKAAPHYLGVTF